MYVDDVISGADTEDEAFAFYEQSKKIFHDAAFNLRKFVTSSKSLQERINLIEQPAQQQQDSGGLDSSDESYGQATLGCFDGPQAGEHKVLGMRWRPDDDLFVFDTSSLAQLASTLQPTKRNVISIVGRFYDPLGFLSPVIVRFKVFFQKLCGNKTSWDCPLSHELSREWRLLLNDLSQGTPLLMSRSYLAGHNGKIVSRHLCGFCDASTQAYATVIYLVQVFEERTVVSFVTAKTRVAPVQPQTVPRLELLSALLLSRLINTVLKGLQSMYPRLQLKYYTDSQVALYWIRGVEREWKPFVQNRVTEIRKLTPPTCWAHCPGTLNPADLPSRGVSQLELSVNRLWHQGPEWLPAEVSRENECRTEEESCSLAMPSECADELKKGSQPTHNLLVAEARPSVGAILNINEYSTLCRLLRVTAYVVKAVRYFKDAAQEKQSILSLAELTEAEKLWILCAQGTLTDDRSFKQLQKQLNLFFDDSGIWRCGGRLSNADIPYATKHPVLLPRNHPFTALIVKDAHEHVAHDGVKETLMEIRTRFWIVKGRSMVKALIHCCVLCRRFEGAPFRGPPPPPLPNFRVRQSPPFTYTGVDFAGPLHVRSFELNSSQKVWISLFTCLVTRAIHLESVTDMTAETFIRCLRRFTARRGFPLLFLSDNGKTFKATARFVRSVFKEQVVQDHLSKRRADWTFNVEKAPWWGGVFERLVRSTKRCLKKMVGRSRLSLDELNTVLAEVEAIINSRPLSYISSDDLEEPLTPSHLLTGRHILSLPDRLIPSHDSLDEEFMLASTSNQLRNRVKRLSDALNYFWIRWRDEYLVELRDVHRYTNLACSPSPQIVVGDVVIVHDEDLPRCSWKLGRVEKVFPGKDGRIRAAVVRLSTGQGTLRRPIQLLYPLEVHDEDDGATDASPDSRGTRTTTETANGTTPSNTEDVTDQGDSSTITVCDKSHPSDGLRSPRTAALEARDRLKAMTLLDEDELERC